MPETLKSPVEFIPIEDEMKALRAEVISLKSENRKLTIKQEDLAAQLKNYKRVVYGSKSEKSKPVATEQLSLFEANAKDDESVLPPGPVKEEAAPENTEAQEATKPKKANRRRKPAAELSLETEEIVLEPTEAELTGPNGERLSIIGYEKSTRVDRKPSRLVNVIIKRPILGDLQSREYNRTVHYPAIINKGKLTDGFIHELIYDKYLMALPLYRQLKDFNRQGAGLSSSILSDAVKAFSRFYSPIYDAIRLESVSGEFVHADESPMTMVEHYRNKENRACKDYKKGYFWLFRNRNACYFHFGATRSHKELATMMAFEGDGLENDIKNNPMYSEYEKKACFGYLMADGYSAYGKAKKEKVIEAQLMACWAHARRKFEPMAKEKSPKALVIFDKINNLYRVERRVNKDAKKDRLNEDAEIALRAKRREEYGKPIMKSIWQWIDEESLSMVPGTAMYKTIGYLQNLREELQVYLSSGSLPIDNNAAENAIRPMVIGRKNYLFVGSEDAGKWAATAYSLSETCRLVCIDFREYLRYTTTALHQGRTDYENLTPHALRKKITRDRGAK